MTKQVEFHHGVLPQCLAALCHEQCELITVTKFRVKHQWCSRVHNWVDSRFEDSCSALAMVTGFTTIWVDRRFEDSCSALAMVTGFTTIWVDRRFEDSCNALAIAAGFTTIWVDRRFEDSCNALAMAAGFTTIWVDRRSEDPCNALAMTAGFSTIWVDRRFEDPCNTLAMAVSSSRMTVSFRVAKPVQHCSQQCLEVINEWGFSDTACDSCCGNVLHMQINRNFGSCLRTSRPFIFCSFKHCLPAFTL